MHTYTVKIRFPYDFKITYSDQGIERTSFTAKTQVNNQNPPHPPHPPLWLKPVIQEVIQYFKTGKGDFSKAPIMYQGATEFQKRIYTNLQKLSADTDISYQSLAEYSGNAKAARAVGSAMKKNAHPVLIPCHRVLLSSGKLGQYSAAGGTKTKQLLLALEKNN